MHRLRMLEEQEAWKREGRFDQIEIIAEMHVQRLPVGLDCEPLYTGLYNLQRLPTPDENTLEMNIEVEQLRLGFLFRSPHHHRRRDDHMRSVRGWMIPECCML